MKKFENQLMDIQIDIVSLCSEYVKNQADMIYMYGIIDGLYSFNVFYNIHGQIVHKHQVNDYLTPDEQIIDVNLQSIVLRENTNSLKEIELLCQSYDREHPTEIWLIYDNVTNSLDVKYSYEGRYAKVEELLPRLEFEKWFEEVKQSRL